MLFLLDDKIVCVVDGWRLVKNHIRKRIYGFADGILKLSTGREVEVKNWRKTQWSN